MSTTANAVVNTGTRPPKAEKVPLKLSAVKNLGEVPVIDEGSLEPIVVVISNGKIHKQITIHRPVGSNDLGAKDWVATPIEEMQTLLANARDPAKAKKEERIAELKQQFGLTGGLYVRDGETLKCRVEVGKTYSNVALAKIRADAKVAYEKAEVAAKEVYLLECNARKSKPKKDWKSGKTVEFFYQEDFKVFAAKLQEDFKANMKEEIAKISGSAFKTLAGPASDRPQIAINTGALELSCDQMVDAVKTTLIQSCRGMGPFKARPSEVSAAFKECGDDPAKLKEFIHQFCFPKLAQ